MTTFFKSISAVTLGIFVVPFFVHAETGTGELCTALRALVSNFPSPTASLVSSVEGMCPVATPQVAPSQKAVCIQARALTVSLYESMTHPQVKNLQAFLNNSGSPIALSGEGSLGNETSYFGAKTELAVQNWQARNGVVTSGTPETTGYGSVGAQTRAKMVAVACGGELSDETSICLSPLIKDANGGCTMPGDTICVAPLYMGPNGTCVRNPSFQCPAGQVLNETVTGCIPATKPSITTFSFPNGVINTEYNAPIVSVGGVGVRNWEITEGALPPGLHLNKLNLTQGGPVSEPYSGVVGQPATLYIYGKPTTAGTYTFTATVSTGALSASKKFRIVIDATVGVDSSITRACTEAQVQTYGAGCRICASTGELASTVEDQECTAPVVTLQYYPSTHSLYWGVVRPQSGGTCSASGSWTGVKPNSGEYTLPSSYSGTYSLTCTGAGPAKRLVITANNTEVITGTTGSVVSDVTEINPTNVSSPILGTKRSADVVVTLKANNSADAITVGRGDNLNFTWSSNAPVTNCKRGTNFKSESAFTQNSGTSGSIPTELARYTYTSRATQGFDYSISCRYRKEGQEYDTEKGDEIRVNVTPVSTMPAAIDPVTY